MNTNTHVVMPAWYAKPIPRALLAAVLSTCLGTLSPPATAQVQPASAQVQRWQLPAGRLAAALDQLGTQSRLQIVYAPELLGGLTTPGLSGQYTPAEALRRLLEGTGIAIDALDETTFVLRRTGKSESRQGVPFPENGVDVVDMEDRSAITDLSGVAVTGTRIRGVQPSSPLVLISQEEMRIAGHNRLEDVLRALPQNFSGGQNPGVLPGGGGGQDNANITGAATLNLRGLGSDSTLSLLNGARLAYDSFTQATDIAVVPVAAIDRIEILLDGASSIYGSDAVAGVANIILKRDFDGADITARYGEATGGGFDQTQISAVIGDVWSSGGLLVAAESTSTGAVYARDRSYLNNISRGDLLMIYPKTSQNGVLLSGHQDMGRLDFALDGFYTKRSMRNDSLTTVYARANTEVVLHGLAPSISADFSNGWAVRVNGSFVDNESKTRTEVFAPATGAQLGVPGVTTYRNGTKAIGVEFEGGLWRAPAGQVRGSFGGGWREFDFTYATTAWATVSDVRSHHVYGEVNLPLIGTDQNIPFVRRLWVNVGARYEDYNAFGRTSTPKIGVTWEASEELTLRASWGKSFKIPTMFQQAGLVQAVLQPAAVAGIMNAPADATFLSFNGGNRDLQPEKAEVATAGFLFRPDWMPGASLEMGWFRIDYNQRVTTPLQFPNISYWGQTLVDPRYARFVTANPSMNQQQQLVALAAIFSNFLPGGGAYDPSKVVAIFDNRYTNTSKQLAQGVDVDFKYAFDAFTSSWTVQAGGSWISEGKRWLVPGLAPVPTVGVVAFPARFKGRLGATWSRGQLTASANITQIGGVRDTRVSEWPKGDEMTVLDVTLAHLATPDSFGGLGFSFSILNALNKRPPVLMPNPPFFVDYDSTNYSPLGRVVSISVSKRF